MAADLTRFDFHASRFMHSYNVERMTDTEVGQYILLMCKAWLGGKDASLPDDPEMLARWARTSEVSELVLNMFPVVDTRYGLRRQNETLFKEWQATVARSLDASEVGKIGGSTSSEAKAEAARRNGLLGGRPAGEDEAKNNPTKPNLTQGTQAQAKSSQTNPNQAVQGGQGSFKNLSIRYRKLFGIGLSTLARESYLAACAQYGEDTVLAKLDEWAPDNQWIRQKRHTNGLRQFYEQLEVMVEVSAEEKQETFDTAAIESSIQIQTEADRQAIQKIAEDAEAAEKFVKENSSSWL